MTDISAVFGKPFAQQVAAFRIRLAQLQPTATWKDVWQAEHDRAFMVAGAQKAELLADFASAIDKAITKGTTLEEFRRDFAKAVKDHDWHGWTGEETEKGRAWRTRVIYKTNMATSYAAGRHAQLKAAGFAYWVYRHGNSREPRLQHLGWNGLILPADHPFWATHYPPNGWGCSCYVVGAGSMAGALRVGGNPAVKLPDDWDAINPATGTPAGISKGWAYAPGASVTDDVVQAARSIARLPAEIGSDFGGDVASSIDRGWPDWVSATTARTSHVPGLAGVLSRDVLEALGRRSIAPKSAEIMMNPGLLSGPKAQRHEAAEDALTAEQWLAIPALLRDPQAVLLDTKTGAILYILRSDGKQPQIAIRLDQLVTRQAKGPKEAFNLIVSAHRVKLSDVVGRLAGGLLELLLGKLV